MKILFLIFLFSCQTVSHKSETYYWNLIVNSKNYPQIKTQKQIKIGPYGCTMDEGVKTLRKPESAPIRWLQCSKGKTFLG